MTTPLRRRRPAAPALDVVEWTQHWRIIDGRYYRDAWVRENDRTERLVAILDTAAVAA